jgi:hypothetical protein
LGQHLHQLIVLLNAALTVLLTQWVFGNFELTHILGKIFQNCHVIHKG